MLSIPKLLQRAVSNMGDCKLPNADNEANIIAPRGRSALGYPPSAVRRHIMRISSYSQTHQAASKNPLHQFCNASSTHQLHPRLKGLQKHCSAILKGKQALSVSTTWPRKVRRNINCTSPHHLWNQHGICPVSEANSGMRTALTMFIAACGIMDKT